MKSFLFTLSLALCLGANLPQKTFSSVCPALEFTQSMVEKDGRYLIKWNALDASMKFKFVDVHVVLENHQGELVGVQRNYPMRRLGDAQPFVAELQDTQMLDALRSKRPDVVLKYSFTYCVGKDGKAVDCDTEMFAFERFEWIAGHFQPCPTECGRQDSEVTRPVQCVLAGTDISRPAQSCDASIKPVAFQSCPATAPCVTFARRSGLVQCPTDCGLSESLLEIPSQCIGSDGQEYSGIECDESSPAPLLCPATAPCVTFHWRPVQVICPTLCGLPSSKIEPEIDCIGSDGQLYPASECAGLTRPPLVSCPATPSCVTFHWRPVQVICPTVCGLSSSKIDPAVECIGSDGQMYEDFNCANLARPPAVHCPATASCVTYGWRAGLVGECPTECGLPASTIPTPFTCVGSEGTLVDDEVCYARKEEAGNPPGAIQCPATEKCLEPLSPYCHPIKYSHSVTPAGPFLKIAFAPYGEDVNRRWIDWVDVHLTIQDHSGNDVSTKENFRMQRPADKPKSDGSAVWTWLSQTALNPGQKLAYSFTYCVEKIDCDTETYYFHHGQTVAGSRGISYRSTNLPRAVASAIQSLPMLSDSYTTTTYTLPRNALFSRTSVLTPVRASAPGPVRVLAGRRANLLGSGVGASGASGASGATGSARSLYGTPGRGFDPNTYG